MAKGQSTEKTVLVTGPTNGIGRATALSLAASGHRLVLLCRNETLGRSLSDEIAALPDARQPVLLIADLGRTDQVRAAVEHFLALNEPLHVLINNAGVVNTKRVLVDVEGTAHEQMFAVNHLGHFLLTNLLLPKLVESAVEAGCASRIVVVASEAHALFCRGIDFDDLSQEKSFRSFRAYGRSKLANILMVKELVKRVDRNQVQVNCLHPGAVRSGLGDNVATKWYTSLIKGLISPFFISPERGAQTSLFLATADVATQGEYYYRSRVHRLKPWALDEAAATRLWEISERAVELALSR